MSDLQFERAVNDWLEDGSDRTPRRAIDGVLLAVKTTPQERDLRIPWRFPTMPALSRSTGAAAVALVAVVGAGTLFFLASNKPGGSGSQATPTPSAATPAASNPGHSDAATGIEAWVPYTSPVHGFAMSYPDDWTAHPATREWQAGDDLFQEPWPWADVFTGPGAGDLSIALWMWEVPAGDGVDLDSVAGLRSWAGQFCAEIGSDACERAAPEAVPMCHDIGGDCRAAIFLPTAQQQFAFFGDWGTMILTGAPDLVTVVMLGREDDHPSAAAYGGSEQLLRSFLEQMDVAP